LITSLEECFSHSFIIVFLNFYPCFREVTSDISNGSIVMIVLTIIIIIIIKEYYSYLMFPLVVLVPGRSQVIVMSLSK
jgi:hypothetical protein